MINFNLFVGYCGTVGSDNHSITYITIFIMVLVVQSCVVCIPAQLLRLVAYVTGLSPAVLTAGGEQGGCEVKRLRLVASDGVPLDSWLTGRRSTVNCND
jgi:hypothetical protein